MPRYPFLDYQLPAYLNQQDGWKRDERRLFGGDPVLTELLKWKAEDADYYTARQAQAGYINLPKLHASTLTGHLSQATPIPNYGRLGDVRPRGEFETPTYAELLHYNVDGIGQDGSELLPWFDGVEERALATGYRWVLVEMPSLDMLTDIRRSHGRDTTGDWTMQDVVEGFRPYAVEYSPLAVPFWQFTSGRLDFAIIRINLPQDNLVNEAGAVQPDRAGYYLLVRRGFTGLGNQWAEGGWWKFDAEHTLKDSGRWDRTLGQIPLFPFIGEPSSGTTEWPTLARSLTMELGQCAVSLMNRKSERNWNVTYSAKSINYILGIGKDQHAIVLEQHESGSIVVGVPPVPNADGRNTIPSMWNSSAAALDANAFKLVIESELAEAREIMVRQVTSTPDSSGRSKEAGFAEATSPLLSRLASTRQQAINTFLYFASLRFGMLNPQATVVIPREFDLKPVVDDIDAMLETIKKTWLRSPTWEADLLLRAGDERGLIPDDKGMRAKIEAELRGSVAPADLAVLNVDQQLGAAQAIRGARPMMNGGNGANPTGQAESAAGAGDSEE